MECPHDYEHPKRLGRAKLVCKDCGEDITLELVLMAECDIDADARSLAATAKS